MSNKKNIYSVSLSNILEWMDYALYGGFAYIIAQKFFPFGDVYTNTMYAYMVFALGFISRPIGAMIFGHIADAIGREKSIVLSICLMAIPTFLIGVLPTYDNIGIWAPILLFVMRFLQSVAIGGEYTGAMVHLVEQAPSNRRGIVGSYADFGCLLGTLIGGQLLSTLLQYIFSYEDYVNFAWRIPFILSIFIIFLAIYIKNNSVLSEDKKENISQEKDQYIPIIDLIKEYKSTCLYVCLSSAFSGINFYTILVFIPNYLVVNSLMTGCEAFMRSAIINFIMIPVVLIAGYLSDITSRKAIIIPGILTLILGVYQMLNNIDNDVGFIWQIICGLGLAFYFGARPAFFAEAFPKKLRCTAVSICLSLSHAIFAGTSPVLATYIAKVYGDVSYFAFYVIIISCGALFGFYKIKDKTGADME